MAEPIRNGGGNVTDVQEIDYLRQIGPRRAGSEAERRVARHLQKRLEQLGRDAHAEPTRVRPAFALTHLIHAVAGVIASIAAVYEPVLGLVIAAAATVSAFGDLTGVFHLVRSLTPVRASQNVVSDEDNGKPGLVVLVAHYDNPRSGMLLGPRLAPVWPRALFGSLALITVCAVARVIGLDATWLTVIQFIPTVVLIAMTPLFADVAIADPGPDTADNDAGVVTALDLAERYSNSLEHFDLLVLFTGASAHSGLGMRDWLKRHRKELDTEATAVVVLDGAPAQAPMYATKEGAVFTSRLHRELVEFADELAEPYSSRELSDAYLARASGLPTIRISPQADIGALLERIDAEIGPRLA
jgi:hypothetical protein